METSQLTDAPQSFPARLRAQAFFIFSIVGILWAVEVLDFLSGQNLELLGGIVPRQIGGLVGIPFAPFLHGDWGHLMGNTIPFLVLGGLVIMSTSHEKFVGVSCTIILSAGFGTWLFAKSGTYHIGASSVIFGFLGFLLWRAWLGRNIGWTVIAILAGFLYGSIILSLFRSQTGISWSGHFFGLVGGIIAAFNYTPKPAAAKLTEV